MQRNKTYIAFFICLMCYTINYGQEKLLHFSLKGKISNVKDSLAIKGATLLDLNTVDGVVTDNKGYFEIDVTENDTLLISSIGYESIKIKMTKDLSKGTELNIDLFPQIEDLPEVELTSYKIIGVLEIDVKNLPKDKYNRIHINGLKQGYETSKSNKVGTSLGAGGINVGNTINKISKLFKSKPKKLKDLEKLKDNDNTRKILTDRFDREIILDYLQMDINKLTQVLSDCEYSSSFIRTSSDLQIIEAVLECYGNNKAIKNGETSK